MTAKEGVTGAGRVANREVLGGVELFLAEGTSFPKLTRIFRIFCVFKEAIFDGVSFPPQ